MLERYKFVQGLGAGCFNIADLYEHTGNHTKVVVRTQILFPEEVKIINGKPTLDSPRMNAEFSFARLVNLMPDNESKYFTKLISWDIAKNINFDINKLCKVTQEQIDDPHNENDNVRIRRMDLTGDVYYLRTIYTFAGNSAAFYIKEMSKSCKINYSYTKTLIKNLIEIVKIARKYKIYISDLHPGNVCTSQNGDAVLIDYGEVVDIYCCTDEDKKYWYSINYDYWNIIKISLNTHYYFNEARGPFRSNKDFMKLNFEAAHKSNKWSIIKRYMVKFTDKLDIINECESGNYENLYYIIEYVDILWSIFDSENSNNFWSVNWEYHHKVPFLLNQRDIIKLLDGYFR